jgi:hypothetical protein
LKGGIPRGDALGDHPNPSHHVCGQKWKIRKGYVKDHLAQHYFMELCNKNKIKGIMHLYKHVA